MSFDTRRIAGQQLKDILQLSPFMVNSSPKSSSNQYNSISNMNDLNLATNNSTVRHNLPNNCTIRVDTTSTQSLFNILSLKVAIEGRESTNSDFTKIERLVDFNWELTRNVNLIAVNNRKPLIAYVLNRRTSALQSNQLQNNQLIRVMNYESRSRCLAKGVFHQTIADLSFAINSISSNSLDILKLAVADRGGNVYIYDVKEDNGNLNMNQVLEIQNDGKLYEYVKLSWCPYIPSEDDDIEVEGDPGLKLAISCDNRLEIFAIDVLRENCNELKVVEISKLRSCGIGYQIIESAHELPINSLSLAQELTAICTTGLDDRIRFYKVSINEKFYPSKMLKQWNLSDEYCHFESDDHISNFFFLDDFDSLLGQSDPVFWGFALIGTKKGHIAILDLKDWRCRQSIKLVSEDSNDTIQEGFAYRLDLTSHFLVAIRGNDAYLIHMKFSQDKEEVDDEMESISNTEPAFDNSHPYINKVTRFQIYNTPLRSFCVKKSIDENLLIFWITSQSLELCHVDLRSICVEEGSADNYDLNSSAKLIDDIENNSVLNSNNESLNASNISTKDIDLMNGTNVNEWQLNINGFKNSIMNSNNTPIDSESQLLSTTDLMPSMNLPVIMPLPPPPTTFSQQSSLHTSQSYEPQENIICLQSNQNMQRPESPASKEVEQIFSPSLALKSILSLGTQNTSSFKFDESKFPKMNTDHKIQSIPLELLESTSFPTKMPDVFKDLVKEEQIMRVKEEIIKELQDSESRINRTIEKLDHKINSRINANQDQVLNNSRVQTSKIEADVREMKKELKIACKIRNEEFNKIVEKLVNKVMHEMNVIVQKGFNEMMTHVDNEIKKVTNNLDKSMITMQSKLMQSIDKTHFQPLTLPVIQTPASATPATPSTPNNYSNQARNSPTYGSQRRTPQNVLIHSVPTTPLPFGTPRSSYHTPVSHVESHVSFESQQAIIALQQKQQQQKQQQIQQQILKNEIIKNVAAGRIEDAITKALNLKDPDLVVQICELYRETPAKLVDAVKTDQLVLISLLQQIIYNLSPMETWKTGFIEQILTNLDFENEFVIRILPGLTPKLIQLLTEIANGNGPHSDKARLLAFTFKNLKLQ